MLWVCVFVCSWICMCVSVWICMCECVNLYVCVCAYGPECVCCSACFYLCGCSSVCESVFRLLCVCVCVCVFTVYWGDAFVYDPKFFRAFLCVSVHTGCVSVLTSTVSCACICVFFYCLCRVCFLSFLLGIIQFLNTPYQVALYLKVLKGREVTRSCSYRVFRKNCVFSQFTATPPSPTSL